MSFESAGFSCSEAENGAEALAAVEKSKPDLIVLDLSMPVMNGLQAAPLLRKKVPQAPILMYTMHVTKELAHLATEVGVSAVVSKDEAVKQLVVRALTLLGGRAASSGT